VIVYRKRQSLFEKAEREWRVEDDALVFRAADGREHRQPWRGATTVRMRYAPSNNLRWRYLFDIVFADGAHWQVDNMHFLGFASFENRAAGYTAFVRSALEHVRAAAPNAGIFAGGSPGCYYAQAALGVVTLVLLAMLLVMLPIGGSWTVLVRLGLVAAMIPLFVRWMRRNRPRVIGPHDDIPRDVLPSQ
jgi:hypothetical protein